MSVSDDLLVAYIDGELAQRECEQVEEYLAQHPEEQHRIAQWRRNDDALRLAFEVDDEPELVASNDNRRWQQLTRYALAACLLLAVGFGGGLGLSKLPFGGGEKYQLQVAAWANEAHEIFAIDARRAGEFGADDAIQATSWLKKRIGVEMTIPDLKADQLQFVGARLVGQGGAPAALMTYETSASERISVFVQAHDQKIDEVGYWFIHGQDKTTCVWLNEQIAFSVTGDLSDEKLKSIALKVRDSVGAGYRANNV